MLARGPDGTGGGRTPRRCGIVDPGGPRRRRLERPEVLEVGAAVERGQAVEAEQADLVRLELAAGALDLRRDPPGELVEPLARDRSLVRRARKRPPKLCEVEALAAPAALSDPQPVGLHALVGGGAISARLARPAALHARAAVGGARGDDARRSSAGGAVHIRIILNSATRRSEALYIAHHQRRPGAYTARAMVDELRRRAERAGEAMASARENAADAMATARDNAADAMATARDNAAEAMATARGSAGDAMATARGSAGDAMATARGSAGDAMATARENAAEAIAKGKPRLRGVFHEYAFPVAVVAGAALVAVAPDGRARLAAAIYAFSLAALLGTSALYHRVNWRRPEIRRWVRRLDHSMIFLLIAGTVTPFALLVLHGG